MKAYDMKTPSLRDLELFRIMGLQASDFEAVFEFLVPSVSFCMMLTLTP